MPVALLSVPDLRCSDTVQSDTSLQPHVFAVQIFHFTNTSSSPVRAFQLSEGMRQRLSAFACSSENTAKFSLSLSLPLSFLSDTTRVLSMREGVEASLLTEKLAQRC